MQFSCMPQYDAEQLHTLGHCDCLLMLIVPQGLYIPLVIGGSSAFIIIIITIRAVTAT